MAQTKCHTNQGLIANAKYSQTEHKNRSYSHRGDTKYEILRVGLPSLAQLTPSDQPAGGGAQVGAGHLFTLLNI